MKSQYRFSLLFFLLIVAGDAYSMGKMFLFSEINGVVVRQGTPVTGATVEQEYRWAWKEESGTAITKTNAQGLFSFPAIVKNSFFGSLLPHEPMVRQTILIHYEGQTYKAWLFDKGNYDNNGELKGKPISLFCDLEAPLSHKGEVYGICQLR